MCCVLLSADASWSQVVAKGNATAAPSNKAVDVSHTAIAAAVQSRPSDALLDVVLGLTRVNGDYNVGVSVVRRKKMVGPVHRGAFVHSKATEVYQVISGTGVFVAGGEMENPKHVNAVTQSEVVKTVGLEYCR